jgi:hypothetical protein
MGSMIMIGKPSRKWCRTNFKGSDFISSLEICIEGTPMVDILVLAKMMRSILMLLLVTIWQPPPILKNVLRIHEMKILLVSLSSKAFLINIQDLIHSLNNKYFQDFVQIFKPYWKLVIWNVTCILGAQEHKITSRGCISTTKFDVFQYYPKLSYLVIGGKNLISSLILSSSLVYKTSYGIAIPHFFCNGTPLLYLFFPYTICVSFPLWLLIDI